MASWAPKGESSRDRTRPTTPESTPLRSCDWRGPHHALARQGWACRGNTRCMRILVAPNALKGSIGPLEAARAIAEGLAQSLPDAEIDELPIADGGDATAMVLVHALGGTFADA